MQSQGCVTDVASDRALSIKATACQVGETAMSAAVRMMIWGKAQILLQIVVPALDVVPVESWTKYLVLTPFLCRSQ